MPGRAVPWGLGRLPWAPGAPPRGSQGGGPAPNYKDQSRPSTLRIRIKNYVDFDVDFWSSWGRSWVPLGGHVGVMLAPFSSQVGPGPVFEPSYHRKSDLSRNITFSNVFWPRWTPRWGQDRPKIAPRRVHDRLGSFFFVLNFRFDF